MICEISRIGKSVETESRLVVVGGRERGQEGRLGMTDKQVPVSFWGDKMF